MTDGSSCTSTPVASTSRQFGGGGLGMGEFEQQNGFGGRGGDDGLAMTMMGTRSDVHSIGTMSPHDDNGHSGACAYSNSSSPRWKGGPSWKRPDGDFPVRPMTSPLLPGRGTFSRPSPRGQHRPAWRHLTQNDDDNHFGFFREQIHRQGLVAWRPAGPRQGAAAVRARSGRRAVWGQIGLAL